MKIGVVGLGKLGLCMAVVYAKRGYDVVGVDISSKVISQIQNKICPDDASEEKGLPELLKTTRLKASTDFQILGGVEIVIIIVPTPSKSDGGYDNSYIIEALKRLSNVVDKEKFKPLVVIKSTVMPGSCENEFLPLLDELSKGMYLCYSPEMVGLGNVIDGLEHPEELLIGEREEEAGDKLQKFYEGLFVGRVVPPFRRMSLWNAELSKIALNAFLVSKVSLANTLARLCDKMPSGNIDKVLRFVGGDSRIGPKFLVTGLGMGGPCFPRDCKALNKALGDISDILMAVDKINTNQCDYIYEKLSPLPAVVSILGITYKPEIQLLDASRVIPLIQKMIRDGISVRLHDPKGLPDAQNIFGDKVYYAKSIEDCLSGSELVVIGTAWDVYKDMKASIIKNSMKKPKVYDCWRIWDWETMRKHGIEYHAFGINDSEYVGGEL